MIAHDRSDSVASRCRNGDPRRCRALHYHLPSPLRLPPLSCPAPILSHADTNLGGVAVVGLVVGQVLAPAPFDVLQLLRLSGALPRRSTDA